jgi:GR25 family glycosyltransferase involved in LPS biosynthesis
MMQPVATPLRAKRTAQVHDRSRAEEIPLAYLDAASLHEGAAHADVNIATYANATVNKKKRKISSKQRGIQLPNTVKRGKIEEHCSEPTAFMRSLDAIVISLARRPDRMDGCAERLKQHAPWLQHKVFAATDGRNETMSPDEVVVSWNTASNVEYQIKRAIRKGWNDLDSYQVRDLELSPGERGCAMSHIRAWRHCIETCSDSNKPLLVLEDDAAPTADFTKVLRRALEALPTDAHVLYLGYSQAADWRREISEELVESEYVWTTVGYLVWPAGARLLLSKTVDGPVDNFMAAQCAAGDLKAYAVQPKIIRQADAWNVNSDVAHSDEHYWGPNSDIQHSDAFYWGNPNADSLSNTGVVDRSNTIWADLDDESEESASE